MSELQHSLFLYAGLITINAIVSGALWLQHRTEVHRSLFLIWVFAVSSLVVQASVSSIPWTVHGASITTFLMNLCLTDVLRRALALRPQWRRYVTFFAACFGLSLTFAFLELPFWCTALPVSLAAALPLLHISSLALRRGWSALSLTARSAIIVAVVSALHQLDYPFLRDVPSMAPFGFGFAIVTTFALSIVAPAIILEASAEQVRRLEAEVIERERLSALGEAAAVVAHEVRNPLATIANIVQLLRKETPEQCAALLAMQETEVRRLDRLVQDLLCFTRPLTPTLDSIDITALLQFAVSSLSPTASASDVRVETEAAGAHVVRADADHLLMALTNVLQNAIEASPRHGTVRVRVTNSRNEVRVSVQDEGPGVPDEALGRVFEPFFTTRARGSGLGLAITQRIMKAHGGEVRVANLGTRGAKFDLVFARPDFQP